MELPHVLSRLAAEKHLAWSLVVRAGSKAYGIDVEGSDDDYVGVFVPRLRDFVSIGGIEKDTYAGNDPDYTVHEIGKPGRFPGPPEAPGKIAVTPHF